MTRAIDDVDPVALGDEVLKPAGTAVGRAHPVGPLTAAAVDEHDRERMPHGAGIMYSTYICWPPMKRRARFRRA